MRLVKKYYWILLTAVFVVLDQISKLLVVKNIKQFDVIEVIPGFFNLAHVRNDGAAMGILDGHRWVFLTFTTIVLLIGFAFLFMGKIKSHFGIVAVTMVLSGGLGNMIDRVFLGEVIDFLSFVFWGYEFYVFNVADIFVCCGVFLLALYILFSKDFDSTKEKEEPANESD